MRTVERFFLIQYLAIVPEHSAAERLRCEMISHSLLHHSFETFGALCRVTLVRNQWDSTTRMQLYGKVFAESRINQVIPVFKHSIFATEDIHAF